MNLQLQEWNALINVNVEAEFRLIIRDGKDGGFRTILVGADPLSAVQIRAS